MLKGPRCPPDEATPLNRRLLPAGSVRRTPQVEAPPPGGYPRWRNDGQPESRQSRRRRRGARAPERRRRLGGHRVPGPERGRAGRAAPEPDRRRRRLQDLQEHPGPPGRGRGSPRADHGPVDRSDGDRLRARGRERGGQGPPGVRPGQPPPGDQRRDPRRGGPDPHPAERPGRAALTQRPAGPARRGDRRPVDHDGRPAQGHAPKPGLRDLGRGRPAPRGRAGPGRGLRTGARGPRDRGRHRRGRHRRGPSRGRNPRPQNPRPQNPRPQNPR